MNQIQLRLTLAPILGFLISCSVVQEAIAFERWAPVHRAKDIGKEEIRDEQGRIYYIIDLAEGSDEPYEDAIVEGRTRPMASRHSRKFTNLITDLAETYKFEDVSATSWVGLSVSAFLDEETANKLRQDRRVTMLTEVTTIEVSTTPPPWQNSPSSTYDFYPSLSYDVQTWGRTAVNGKTSFVNGTPYDEQVGYTAYVLDLGVGEHMDLNVGKRVNTSCTSPTTNGCISGTDPLLFPTVGCWAHATHVAGIIGARSNNQGVSGINAGMKILITDEFQPT